MVKRDDSGSGLRAGFVRGERAPAPPKVKKASEAKKDQTETQKEEKAKQAAEANAEASEPTKDDGPTITMQGVSGKKITGVVKVVKKKRPEKSEKAQTAPGRASTAVPPPAVPPGSVSPPPVKAAAEPLKADAGDKKKTAAAEAKEKTAAAAEPVKGTDTEPVKKKTADQPVKAPTSVASAADSEGPVKTVPTKPRAPRAQSRRSINPAELAPGQGGEFTRRPPQGPQSGRRIDPSEFAPGQGGSYTASSRPQRPRPAQGRPPQDRPRGPARPSRPSMPPAAGDIKEKIIEQPRANFAARDAFDKDSKREPRRDNRRDATTKIEPAVRDKHQTLKKQAQVLSGKGVSDVLSDAALLDPFDGRSGRSRSRGRNRRNQRNHQSRSSTPAVRAVLTHVKLPETLTVKEFAEAIKKTSAEVIKKLIGLGVMATLNQEIDFDTATLIAAEFNITTEKLVEVKEEDILFDDSEDQDDDLQTRPPVVVVMGHVDHGKTSILDRIRKASVVEGEAGGITQHIGAYMVNVNDRAITFLDTPGHEAFTTMRARGAQVTDIAILVVAADDGVMPQTIEAINHAKAAGTQILVAINKIDKPDINIDRVKQELSNYELIPEEWGGSTVMVPVSAMTGQGMDELLEMVLLSADLLELKSNPDKQAKGTVIEARLDRNRGPVATVLVQRGTLRNGDTLVTGSIVGHVRAMTDDHGQTVKEAGPSVPVELLGLPEVPEAGELFYAVTDDRTARALVERRRSEQREQQLRSSSRMSLDTLFSQMAAGEVKDLNIIVKADVQGSVEAVRQSLEKLTTDQVRVNVIHGAVGAVTESDVRLAEVSNAIIIGFNVRPAANVADLATEAEVDIRLYRVIYNAIEDIEAAMKGMLAPEFKEVVHGHAEVRQVFRVTGVGVVAGCYVTDGKITRSSEVRIVRDGIVVHEGRLASLRRFKDDVREVATGYECGIGIERFNDIKENDVIESFEMKEIERS